MMWRLMVVYQIKRLIIPLSIDKSLLFNNNLVLSQERPENSTFEIIGYMTNKNAALEEKG